VIGRQINSSYIIINRKKYGMSYFLRGRQNFYFIKQAFILDTKFSAVILRPRTGRICLAFPHMTRHLLRGHSLAAWDSHMAPYCSSLFNASYRRSCNPQQIGSTFPYSRLSFAAQGQIIIWLTLT
jgi:hypothetical protein